MKTLKELIDDFIYESDYECIITQDPYYKNIIEKQKEAQNDLLRAIQNKEKTKNIDNKIEILNDTFLAANEMYRYYDVKTALEAGIIIGIDAAKNKNNDLITKIEKLLED
ncbi:hypothetical protein [Thomasclavelia ramosa]|uniref:hypothetical protein n=1 Tax=Thomasclavelia ramosa TaxID=1547 RepID=UPI0032C0799E